MMALRFGSALLQNSGNEMNEADNRDYLEERRSDDSPFAETPKSRAC
jgi:hypothetical protein